MQLRDKIKEREIEVHIKTSRSGVKSNHIGYLTEDIMLADFMTFAKNEYPQLRKAIFHIENEGDTSSEHARFKGAQSLAKGKLKGVFDVESVYGGKIAFAEFKLLYGRWSPEQLELSELWSSWGIPIFEIKTFRDWENFLEFILK